MDMKVVDDKLKIIDEVPSSAVEMSVKEKVTITWIFTGWWFKVVIYSTVLTTLLDPRSKIRRENNQCFRSGGQPPTFSYPAS